VTDLTGRKPILCLDFDGVCHSYTSGWKGAHVIPDLPVPGMWQFLREAVEVFEVNIFSSRSHQKGGLSAMQAWFMAHADAVDLPTVDRLVFPLEKPPALVGIDDRVICFQGRWPEVMALLRFKPWNAKEV